VAEEPNYSPTSLPPVGGKWGDRTSHARNINEVLRTLSSELSPQYSWP